MWQYATQQSRHSFEAKRTLVRTQFIHLILKMSRNFFCTLCLENHPPSSIRFFFPCGRGSIAGRTSLENRKPLDPTNKKCCLFFFVNTFKTSLHETLQHPMARDHARAGFFLERRRHRHCRCHDNRNAILSGRLFQIEEMAEISETGDYGGDGILVQLLGFHSAPRCVRFRRGDARVSEGSARVGFLTSFPH